MAFISTDTIFYSYAEYSDVTDMDQRLFEANEGINDSDEIEDILIKASNRINHKLTRDLGLSSDINPLLVLDRQADFTDLCVYFALANYILPKIADFGEDDNAEVKKIHFYETKFSVLYDELVAEGGWYDKDENATVDLEENAMLHNRLKRVR